MEADEYWAQAEKTKSRLYRVAAMYLGSESMALDAVEEAVFKGFKSRGKLRQPEFFGTWMTRILINECKKELNRNKRERLMDTLPETATEEFDSLPLKEAVRRLPQELKDVIILRYFSGLTLAETAQSLEIPIGTAATRQRRALALLKIGLSEEE
ncbi:MAG: sigma-70 family RNA polymerase sigma factor [Clostridiales bacterium]|jgi:RNA polymerase sigma-70 factor (ECF subfamily)|nr:sigma-70 family RNA polymerase sigma factor [Clostridiales bacterium]